LLFFRFSFSIAVSIVLLVGSASAQSFVKSHHSTAAQAPSGPSSSLSETDPELTSGLRDILARLHLRLPAEQKRFSVSLVDVTDPRRPRYAGVNDCEMMYAASLPKIAILLAGFEKIRQGQMNYTAETRRMFTNLARYSSNVDASRAIQQIGFPFIARTLTHPRYRLYDPAMNGGLWLGKAYGGPNDRWKRDPLHNLSHGATSLQVARYLTMLEQGSLVSPRYSAEIKEILSKPGISHKFVKGLSNTPGREIFRKSGTWRDYHADAAIIKAGSKTYIAVALMQDNRGAEIFPKLIRELDRLIVSNDLHLAQ
jgi:beta-lactamase class A